MLYDVSFIVKIPSAIEAISYLWTRSDYSVNYLGRSVATKLLLQPLSIQALCKQRLFFDQ